MNACKHVYCEWPLGNGLKEAIHIANFIKKNNRYGPIGLQARAGPAIRFIKDLVRDGYICNVLSNTLIGSGMIQGPSIEETFAYAADRGHPGVFELSIKVV